MATPSEQEQQNRRAAIEAGIASIRLSGLDVPPAYETQAARYIAGEIQLCELGEFVEHLARDHLMANPTPQEIELAAARGRQPGAVGDNDAGQLVRVRPDGTHEPIEDANTTR